MKNSGMSKSVIKIAVVSDVVCPWCYIGKRRLEKAVATLSDKFDFEIAYYPYELNPDMPLEGKNHKEYLTAKFGDESEYERLTQHVSDIASSEGLNFDFEKQTVSPNTRNAHRLILLAKEDGKDIELVEIFFKAYFEEGVDLSKNENLVMLATRAGMQTEKVKRFLETDTGVTEVALAEKELQRMGIRGVPFYIVNDKYGISGAQPTSAFIEAFQNVSKEIAADANSCNVDEQNC
jgi:predicted DsbA family dithiol-disulfide isomerase